MQEDQTDAQLVMRARVDDIEAFTLLIERYQVMLTYIALRYIADKEIARELVQEALLQAYLSLDQLRDAARFKSWLYGIVLNLCRNWLHKDKGSARGLNTSLDHESFDHSSLLAQYDDEYSPDPQELVVEQELQHIVREAVHMLSPKNRTVMQLFYYEGLTLTQIAQHLDISLAAVKSRMHKGRDQLRTHLKTLYPELAEMSTRKERHTTMVTVTLAKVLHRVEIHPRRTILVLLDEQHQRALPLWFSDIKSLQSGRVQPFAQEKGILLEPLATDFLANILSASEASVEEIAINTLQIDPFNAVLYARIRIRSVNATQVVKAHLNDALPLALRLNCPLAVSEDILSAMGIKLTEWGETLEQQIDAVTELAAKTPVMNSQETLHAVVPRNLNFEDGLRGWRLTGSGGPERYHLQLDAQTTYRNKNSLAITLQEGEPVEVPSSRAAHLMHEGFLADRYRGQRLRMITHIKTQGVTSAFFDIKVIGVELITEQESTNAKSYIIITRERPFEGTSDWTRHELIFDVPEDASSILLSFEMQEQGKIWFDGFQFERVEKSVPLTGGTETRPSPQHPQNLDFTHALENWHMVGSFAQDYTYGIDDAATGHGIASAYLKADKPDPRGSVILMQTVSSQNYRNKRIRFSASLRTAGVIQQAGLYLKAGSRDKTERKENSIQGNTDWTRYDLTLAVPDDDRAPIDFGLTLHGTGQVWMQDVHLDIVETPE